MMEEIICNICGWTGDSTMLVTAIEASEDNIYNRCPDCNSMDIEDIKDE